MKKQKAKDRMIEKLQMERNRRNILKNYTSMTIYVVFFVMTFMQTQRIANPLGFYSLINRFTTLTFRTSAETLPLYFQTQA